MTTFVFEDMEARIAKANSRAKSQRDARKAKLQHNRISTAAIAGKRTAP